MHIQYRTVEGELIERIVEYDITINDIDCLAMQYFEKTGREPDAVFMDVKEYWNLQQSVAVSARNHSASISSVGGATNMQLMLSMGIVPVKPVRNSYTPILVGTEIEYQDNDINKVFEETVLKDCDRET